MTETPANHQDDEAGQRLSLMQHLLQLAREGLKGDEDESYEALTAIHMLVWQTLAHVEEKTTHANHYPQGDCSRTG